MDQLTLPLSWSLERSSAPATEPVTAAEAKAHLNVTHSSDDTLIGNLITVAREQLERDTGRGFITQTWKLRLDSFPGEDWIDLRKAPVSAVAIAYVDTAGATQTLSSGVYNLHAGRVRPMVALAYGQAWPAVRGQRDAVTLTLTVGYGAAAAVPLDAKQAILLLIEHHYQHRGDVADGTISKFDIAYERLMRRLRLPEYP